jgi:hypothetical protein
MQDQDLVDDRLDGVPATKDLKDCSIRVVRAKDESRDLRLTIEGTNVLRKDVTHDWPSAKAIQFLIKVFQLVPHFTIAKRTCIIDAKCLAKVRGARQVFLSVSRWPEVS